MYFVPYSLWGKLRACREGDAIAYWCHGSHPCGELRHVMGCPRCPLFRQISPTSLFFSGALVRQLVASTGRKLGRRYGSFARAAGFRKGIHEFSKEAPFESLRSRFRCGAVFKWLNNDFLKRLESVGILFGCTTEIYGVLSFHLPCCP